MATKPPTSIAMYHCKPRDLLGSGGSGGGPSLDTPMPRRIWARRGDSYGKTWEKPQEKWEDIGKTEGKWEDIGKTTGKMGRHRKNRRKMGKHGEKLWFMVENSGIYF